MHFFKKNKRGIIIVPVFKKINLFIYLFIFGCGGSSLLCVDFAQLWRAGATLCCSARASCCSGFSCCGARALGVRASVVVAQGLNSCGTRAQQLWRTGLVAPRHVGSSQTRARTRVPCIGRRILNHCATREVLVPLFHMYICTGQYIYYTLSFLLSV